MQRSTLAPRITQLLRERAAPGAPEADMFCGPGALAASPTTRLSRAHARLRVATVRHARHTHSDLTALSIAVGHARSDLATLSIAVRDAKSDLTALLIAVGDARSDLAALSIAVGDAKSDLTALSIAVGDAKSDLTALSSAVGDAKLDLGVVRPRRRSAIGAPGHAS